MEGRDATKVQPLQTLELLLAFTGIRVAADRLKVIELARRLSRDASKHSRPVRH
jgi:hypothetical protein